MQCHREAGQQNGNAHARVVGNAPYRETLVARKLRVDASQRVTFGT